MELPRGYLRAISRFEVYGIPDRFIAEITQKTNLAFLAQENPRTLGRFTPKTYYWNRSLQHDVDYRAQQKLFLQAFAEEVNETEGSEILWVLKKESTSRGRGITLVPATAAIEELAKPRILNTPHVAQRYLQRPCLLPSTAFPGQGYKFDLRLYVVVMLDQTGDEGSLRAYQYYEGFVRRCQNLYQGSDQAGAKSVHLTNSAVNAKDGDPELREFIRMLKKRLRNASAAEAFLLPLVDDEDSSDEDEGSEDEEADHELEFPKTMLLSQAFDVLERSNVTTHKQNARIQEDVSRLLEELIACGSHASKHVIAQEKHGLQYQKHFAVLGVDVMLDENLKPWLIEVNRYPDFKIYSLSQLGVKQSLVLDILSLVFPECNPQELVSVADALQADMLYERLNPCFEDHIAPQKALPTNCPAWKELNISTNVSTEGTGLPA